MMKVFMGEAADKDRQVFEDAGKCTTEATMNIRTVASLGREDHFVDKYRKRFILCLISFYLCLFFLSLLTAFFLSD